MNQQQNIIHSDKREWLDKVHQQRKNRSLTIGIQTINFLVEQGIPVTYHNISEHSKVVDGKGIHQNTIKRNEELHSYYQKYNRTYKVKTCIKSLQHPLLSTKNL